MSELGCERYKNLPKDEKQRLVALREKCLYLEFFWFVFSPNTGTYEPGKLQIQTLFTLRVPRNQ